MQYISLLQTLQELEKLETPGSLDPRFPDADRTARAATRLLQALRNSTTRPRVAERLPYGGASYNDEELYPDVKRVLIHAATTVERIENRKFRFIGAWLEAGKSEADLPKFELQPEDEPIETSDYFNVCMAAGFDQAEVFSCLGLMPPTAIASTTETVRAPATGTPKVWTDERKAEARAYREKHGLKKTAEHYGVSETTISKHIPANKPTPKPAPWTQGLGKR